ncbi:MAG: HEPN domain-containing protein [Bdellovibrionota bacterium]
MPHDPVRVADTKAWLLKAKNDLRACEIDLGATPPLLEDTLFHCQQAVEKALKGFLAWHDRPSRKTHSLEEIGEQCLAIDDSLRPFVDRAVPLTEYAWVFRYPGEPEPPKLEEAKAAFSLANEIYQAISSRLPPESHP